MRLDTVAKFDISRRLEHYFIGLTKCVTLFNTQQIIKVNSVYMNDLVNFKNHEDIFCDCTVKCSFFIDDRDRLVELLKDDNSRKTFPVIKYGDDHEMVFKSITFDFALVDRYSYAVANTIITIGKGSSLHREIMTWIENEDVLY